MSRLGRDALGFGSIAASCGGAALTARFLSGASLLALGIVAAPPALAQDSAEQQEQVESPETIDDTPPPRTGTAEPQPEVVEDGDTIIVTGIRQSLRSARNIKRNADQIVDSVTAQDIGALPDRSVSEALQRIPGVTLQRTNEARDPARLSAEGGGVFVRGLSWVRSELNGRGVFSANNGRLLSFEDVSAELLAGIDVYKNPSAEMIEGGIGGLVNLRTRKPFDQTGQMIAFSTDYNFADMRDDGFWSGSGLYSNRWDTGVGELGLLLSFGIGTIGNRTDSVQTGEYTARGSGGTGPFIPITLGHRRIDWEQKRTSLAGSLQWRPVPDLLITAEALRAKATPEDLELNVGDYFSPLPDSDPSYVFDDRGVLQSGTVAGRLLDNNTRFGKRVNKTADYSLNMQYAATDRLTFSGDVQYVKSTMRLESMTVFVQPENPMTVEFDLSGDDPDIHYTAPGDPHTDQSTYWWAAAMDHHERNEADQWAYRADADYEFDNPFLKSFRFGARATDRNAISRSTSWNWNILSRQHWASWMTPARLDEQGGVGAAPAGPNPGLPNQSSLVFFPDFLRGDVTPSGGFWFGSRDLVSNGTGHAFSFLESTLTNGWGWTPLGEEQWDPVGGVNIQNEETLAGYGLLRFGQEDGPIGRFDGNIGLRVVQTQNSAESTGVQLGLGSQIANPESRAALLETCLATNSAAACADLAAAVAFLGSATPENPGELAEIIPAENDYTNVLPSLNLRFFLRDDLQLRLAAGRAITRPSFVQLNPFTSLNFNFTTEGTVAPGTVAFTGIGASPRLKPIRSNQVDASLEWYFGESGQLSGALFYKDLRDFIFAGNEVVTLTNNGETVDFLLTTLQNGDKGSIRGVELAYQQFYDFLPAPFDGLGLQANFTYIDSKGIRNTVLNPRDPNIIAGSEADLPLEGMSKYSYNLAGMYEKYGFTARLAWNWRSEYLLTTSAANINRPVWAEDYGQLDGSLFYNLTPSLKLGLQGTNLLKARTFLDVGGSDLHPRYSWTDTDRRIAFVVRGQF